MRLLTLVFAVLLPLSAAHAQLVVPAFGQSSAEESAPAAEAAPAADAAAAEEPELPATVTDPAITPDILQIRLLPLTKSELKATAAEWLEIVKAKTTEVSDLMVAISEAGSDATDQQRERLATLQTERKALFDDYSKVIAAWELKGGDAAAIKEYRDYQSAIFFDEVRTSDTKTLFKRALNWTTSWNGGVGIAFNIAVVVFAFLALLFAARVVRRLTRRGVQRIPNLSKLLQAFVLVVVYWLTIAIGLMVVLSALGVDVTPLFAVLGGASFIMAFALQDTLSNLAAGLMIMINRPFDEGHYVDIAGTAGTVQKMNIVSTTVTTPDNQVILIPNGKVWGNIITNVTGSTLRRVDLVFGIGYSDSVADAQELLEKIVAEHSLTLADPAPMIRVHALGESSVDFIVRPWVRSEDYWTVYWDLTREVKVRFDEAGISIPFPQRDVHVYQVPSEAPAPAPAVAGAAVGVAAAASATAAKEPPPSESSDEQDDTSG